MGIFDDRVNLFTDYEATIKFRDKLMGATPKDPKIIESWLRSKTGVTDQQELVQMMARTLIELGADVRPNMSYDEMVEASEKMAGTRNCVGFKRDESNGLFIESRVVKSMLKECVNVLYPYQAEDNRGKWGVTKKAARSYLAERVFVDPDRIYLGGTEPTGVDLFIGHVVGPQGPRSTLTYHEYVLQPEMSFTVRVAEDGVKEEYWPQIWVLAQENALGALRSQGFGRFDILRWDRVGSSKRKIVELPDKRLSAQEVAI